MLSSITSKIHHFRFRSSVLLSQFEILLSYHTSPHKNPQFAHKPIQNQSTSTLSSFPAPTHFEFSDFRPEIVLETLNCYANDWKRALEFFNWVESRSGFQHTTQTLNRILDILGKFFEFDIAWSLIERMRNNPCSLPDYTTFRVLFKRYVSAHLVNEAIDAFVKSDEYNLRDEITFSNLIDALCEYKHVIEADELCFRRNSDNNTLYNYKDCVLDFDVENTKFYNMILRGWFKMKWWRKCREFWEEMDKRGVKKDLYSYSIYMDIQSKSGKPWKAVKTYKEMKRNGICLDVVAYNTVIRAIGISEGVDVAVSLYREMIELGCEPNVVTFNTIVKLLCESGRYREAHKVLNLMMKKGCKPDLVTYHCFFTTLEKPREILRFFDRMVESGIRPCLDTYVLLMRKFGRWGFLRPVLDLWEKMAEHGLSPDESAYNALIDALLQKGLVDMARKYDEEMLSKGLSAKPRAELVSNVDTEGSDNG